MDTVFKYETQVQKNGLIRIPKRIDLAHQRVEVIICPLPPKSKESAESAKAFVEKWRGVLKGFDPDELKAQYLQEKHG